MYLFYIGIVVQQEPDFTYYYKSLPIKKVIESNAVLLSNKKEEFAIVISQRIYVERKLNEASYKKRNRRKERSKKKDEFKG